VEYVLLRSAFMSYGIPSSCRHVALSQKFCSVLRIFIVSNVGRNKEFLNHLIQQGSNELPKKYIVLRSKHRQPDAVFTSLPTT
jgi:hypothetical protein